MDARRHTETTETTTPPATETAPARVKGGTSDAVKAGQLFNRLAELDEEEQAELAASPADIRAKYEQRRTREIAKYAEPVQKLAEKLRA